MPLKISLQDSMSLCNVQNVCTFLHTLWLPTSLLWHDRSPTTWFYLLPFQTLYSYPPENVFFSNSHWLFAHHRIYLVSQPHVLHMLFSEQNAPLYYPIKVSSLKIQAISCLFLKASLDFQTAVYTCVIISCYNKILHFSINVSKYTFLHYQLFKCGPYFIVFSMPKTLPNNQHTRDIKGI